MVAATNNALQPSTIATYLTQMWIGNILQVIICQKLSTWLFFGKNSRKQILSLVWEKGHKNEMFQTIGWSVVGAFVGANSGR